MGAKLTACVINSSNKIHASGKKAIAQGVELVFQGTLLSENPEVRLSEKSQAIIPDME
jgi:hypothetical protein